MSETTNATGERIAGRGPRPVVNANTAAKAANTITNLLFEAHRGAIKCSSGVCLVFGNDGYQDDRAKLEVDLLRQYLHDGGVAELAFGTCDEGYTWVLLVNSEDATNLNAWVWDAARIAFGVGGTVNSVQKALAESKCRICGDCLLT